MSSESASSLPQSYSIISSAIPISSDASTILPASTLCPTSLGSTIHPTSIESSAARTSIAPASTVAPTSAASTNPLNSCDAPGSRGGANGLLLPGSAGSGSGLPQPWTAQTMAALHQRYVSFASSSSPRLRHYPKNRPVRLRPSPRRLKNRTPNATLTLFPSSGSLPRPLTPNMSPRNSAADLTLRPHDMQPSTHSTQRGSDPPSLDAIADSATQPAFPEEAAVGMSSVAELSTVEELSTVPDAPEEDEEAGTTEDLEVTGALLGGDLSEVPPVPYAADEADTTVELEEPGQAAARSMQDYESEGSDEVLALPGLPSSMSSVHSGGLSASLRRKKQVVEQLVSSGTASSYATVESCMWGTPRDPGRSRRVRAASSSGYSSGGSTRSTRNRLVPRPLAGPQRRHVYRASRIDVHALLAQNQCAAAAAAAAAAKPGMLGSPETAVQAAHERVLPHVPLAHEAQPRGAHFGVLPARRAPPDSVGSTLSTASVVLPASRGADARVSIDAAVPPPAPKDAPARPGWR